MARRIRYSYRDACHCLQWAYDRLIESGSIHEAELTQHEYDRKYVGRLIKLCQSIVDDFSDTEGPIDDGYDDDDFDDYYDTHEFKSIR